MAWIQLKIDVDAKEVHNLTNFLELNEALSVTYMDKEDTPIFEPKPGETRLWQNTVVTALYDAEVDLIPLVEKLKQAKILHQDFAYKIEQLEDKDWSRAWMDDFHPMQFGEKLWIVPSWSEIPDPNAVNVMLDPGLAFGTGTHPTTELCLRYLDGVDLQGKTVIDFGCGSGILAIAALKLGAKRAIGIDIDPQAITASEYNAQNNGVSDKLELYLPHQMPKNLQADVMVANILSGPLKELYPNIDALVKNGATLCLSGVLSVQFDGVKEVYQQSFNIDPITEKDEWCRITGLKK